MLRIGLIASLFAFYGQSQGKYYSKMRAKLMQFMKRMNSNCAGILPDEGKADTASNLNEQTLISLKRHSWAVNIFHKVFLWFQRQFVVFTRWFRYERETN